MVVPQHDFVVWPLRAFASTHKSQNVTPVEHLNDADSSVDVSDKLTTEGHTIEYAEACLRAHCKAVLILIEAYVQDILLRGCLCHCHFSAIVSNLILILI